MKTSTMIDVSYTHTFPAIRGIQAGRPCYIAMCPMRIVPKLFRFDEEDVPPELRAQRVLNRQRIPEISSYLVENSMDYTLSSLTASVSSKVTFSPMSDTGVGQNIGTLSIPMDAQILINDGQHRRAAIEEAIKENPELGYDNISVLFFIDEGLARSQQMFADLNKHAIRPSDSISTLYDLRDSISDLARHVQKNVPLFARMTEMEKSSISNRSTKLLTLSSIKNASKALLRKNNKEQILIEEKNLAIEFWEAVVANMSDWQAALRKEIAPAELRNDYVHAHGVMLQAMGQIGADLLTQHRNNWKTILQGLKNIDWSRNNPDWEGRAMIQGRISKAHINVMLTGNYIKQELNIPLNPVEAEAERGMKK
ncbi:MAG: DNA sulfur modification protein DndB [Candidatus Thiothrix moscowensis]|nr:DNA sulfur modification protein DndB [Candidatus Thiothrix moscowensis]